MIEFKKVKPEDIVSEIAKGKDIYCIDRLPDGEEFGIRRLNDMRTYDALNIIQDVARDKQGRYELYRIED